MRRAIALVQVNRNPSRRDVRQFGWVVFGGFVVIAAILAAWGLRSDEGSARLIAAGVLAGAGMLIAIVSRISYAAGRILYIGWMTPALWLGLVMTTVLLTVLYFLLLPWFALIRFRDPLRLRRHGGSYWEEPSHHAATLERTRRPF